VAAADPQWLTRELGKAGSHFHALANAEDPRTVASERESKSIGSEVTLERDIRIGDEMKRHLRRSAEEIGRRLRRKNYVAFGVRVKLKTADFQILTRQHRLARPTDVAEELYSVAVALLAEFWHAGPFRLVGMAAYDLTDGSESAEPDLFASGVRRRKLEVAVDALAQRFGPNILRHADDLDRRPRMAPNLDFLDDMDE